MLRRRWAATRLLTHELQRARAAQKRLCLELRNSGKFVDGVPGSDEDPHDLAWVIAKEESENENTRCSRGLASDAGIFTDVREVAPDTKELTTVDRRESKFCGVEFDNRETRESISSVSLSP